MAKRKEVAASLLFIIFVFYYANIFFFSHSHEINGVTIVHSHLHEKGHCNGVGHTTNELILISELSLFQSLCAILIFFSFGGFVILGSLGLSFSPVSILSFSGTCKSLRAPPHMAIV